MRLDFKSLAFGYKLTDGVSTPAWETSLGQGAGYKINDSRTINELIKGMIYKMVPPKSVSFKKGRGGTIVKGDADNASLVSAAVFDKVFINEHQILNGKFILLIVKDDSESHKGRLKLKYGLDNAYESDDGTIVKNRDFQNIAATQLGLAENACWFIYDISVENQDVLRLSAIFVNKDDSETYANSAALHNAWDALIEADISAKGLDSRVAEETISANEFLSNEWFKEMANNYPEFDEKASELLENFNKKFNPDVLAELSGLDLLNNIFLNPDNPDNLCRALEFHPELTEFFGSIKGGNAYKYGLFYSSNGMWMTGSHQKPRELTQDEAIAIGTEIRNRLVAGARVISTYGPVNEIDDYKKLYKLLEEATNGDINKVWFMKYYQMLYPELFAPNYSDYAQRIVLGSLGIEKEKYPLVRMGQIRFYADECGLSNVLFSKIFWDNYEEPVDGEATDDNTQISYTVFDYSTTKNDGVNKIFYGVPGCGKSYHIENVELEDFEEENRIRTTFYQDYSNTDFVGQILPKIIKGAGDDRDTVEYIFNPGPFTLALIQAISNPTKKVALVVEEINRGNAPAIFGDIFQLLDRNDDCISEYGIVNVGVLDYLNNYVFTIDGEKKKYIFNEIKIPGNMYIYATMNTSDQNVYTLDTAFTRRWSKERIENKFGNNEIKDMLVPGTEDCTWETFVDKLNAHIRNKIDDLQVNEDKQVGCFFVKKSDLLVKDETDEDKKKAKAFAYKVLEYLWDDVSKLDHSVIFNPTYKTFEDLVKDYLEKGVEVFNGEIFK